MYGIGTVAYIVPIHKSWNPKPEQAYVLDFKLPGVVPVKGPDPSSLEDRAEDVLQDWLDEMSRAKAA